jgi:hypothetical protein
MRRQPDWRIWFGLAITSAWLILGVLYIESTTGWTRFTRMPADELGNFLEGAFAPLAFLWLVIGYFLQKKELEQNTAALQSQALQIQRSAEQATIQAEKMAESEVHARQETFLQIVKHVSAQLGSIGGLLYLSSQGAAGDGQVSSDQVSRLFAQQAAQDVSLFSRLLVQTHVRLSDPAEQHALFFGSETRARHTNNFIFTFERLMRRAEAVDPDFMIRDSLLATGHGLLYRLVIRHQGIAAPDLADPAQTGIHINF